MYVLNVRAAGNCKFCFLMFVQVLMFPPENKTKLVPKKPGITSFVLFL